jgi:hypothetical protein
LVVEVPAVWDGARNGAPFSFPFSGGPIPIGEKVLIFACRLSR